MFSENGKRLYVINRFKFLFHKLFINNLDRFCCIKNVYPDYLKITEDKIYFIIMNISDFNNHNLEKVDLNVLVFNRQKLSNNVKEHYKKTLMKNRLR